ncbi:hypothetical protein QUW13_11600, partial [Enterococcus hirae]|nr:hypothetical protein [Enterococcus hirae]
ASRNKKKNPKIVSYIFEIFRLISEEAAFETPFIRKKRLGHDFCPSLLFFPFEDRNRDIQTDKM